MNDVKVFTRTLHQAHQISIDLLDVFSKTKHKSISENYPILKNMLNVLKTQSSKLKKLKPLSKSMAHDAYKEYVKFTDTQDTARFQLEMSDRLQKTYGTVHKQLMPLLKQEIYLLEILNETVLRTTILSQLEWIDYERMNSIFKNVNKMVLFLGRMELLNTSCVATNPLIGPVSLTIMDRKSDGSRVVLIGDIHVFKSMCPTNSECGMVLYKYLEQLFVNYRGLEYIDFFMETRYGDKSLSAEDMPIIRRDISEFKNNYLEKTILYFNDCFNKNPKKRCVSYFGNRVRFHYSDVRDGVIHSGTDEKTKTQIQMLQQIQTKLFKRQMLNVSQFLFLKLIVKHYRANNVDYFFKLTKIDKQLKKINNVKITNMFINNLIMRFSHPSTQKSVAMLEKILTLYAFYDMLPNDEKKEIANQFLQIPILLIDVFVALLDLYIVARIVRHNMKQVIVYAGDFHIQNLKLLFHDLDYMQTFSRQSDIKGVNFQCIDTNGMPRWFS